MPLSQKPVCVVDDDEAIREAVQGLMRSAGLRCETFPTARAFLDRPGSPETGCLVLDVNLPDLNGLELQRDLQRAQVDVPIVFVTGYGDIPTSVRAIKAGALEFFTKPFDADELLDAVRRGMAASSRHVPSNGIVGTSATLQATMRQIHTVAATSTTVLVQGETGTGKELVARAIHAGSPHCKGPFVRVNCAALPAALLESELMGHERGAFTGAVARRIGRFELAQDGTLFLDEIGELSLDLQPKLLRLLQEREFERVGGNQTIRSNARVVVATHRDLAQMVEARTFREDLYYRLAVFPIDLPPLRARRDDLPALVRHFVAEVCERLGRAPCVVPAEAMTTLVQHDWPGNVRELQNVLERAVILSADVLELPPLGRGRMGGPPAPREAPAPQGAQTSREDLSGVCRSHILAVLEQTNWVVGGPEGAAARLGLKRSTLNFRMKKLGITREGRVLSRAG